MILDSAKKVWRLNAGPSRRPLRPGMEIMIENEEYQVVTAGPGGASIKPVRGGESRVISSESEVYVMCCKRENGNGGGNKQEREEEKKEKEEEERKEGGRVEERIKEVDIVKEEENAGISLANLVSHAQLAEEERQEARPDLAPPTNVTMFSPATHWGEAHNSYNHALEQAIYDGDQPSLKSLPALAKELSADPISFDNTKKEEETMSDETTPTAAPDSEARMYTLTEMEKLTGIKYVTLTRYVQEHLSRIPHEGTGRARRYPAEAAEVFKQIKEEKAGGRGVAAQTTEGFPPPARHIDKEKPKRGRPAGKSAGSSTGARKPSPSSSPASSPLSALSRSNRAMDDAVTAFERAQDVTRLELIERIVEPLIAERDRLRKSLGIGKEEEE